MRVLVIICLTLISFSFQKSGDEHPHWAMMNLAEGKPTKEVFKLWHYSMKREYSLNDSIAIQKYKNFKANMKFIKAENAKQTSYKLGPGPYADMTFEEFKKQLLTLNPTNLVNQANSFFQQDNTKGFNFDLRAAAIDREDGDDDDEPWVKDNDEDDDHPIIKARTVPANCTINPEPNPDPNPDPNPGPTPPPPVTVIDWTDSMQVKDQGNCGSCWAFATTSIIEGADWIRKSVKSHSPISPQQFVDCDTSNYGCNGGWYSGALNYAKANPLASIADYSYTAVQGACKNVTGRYKVGNTFGCVQPNCQVSAEEAIKRAPYASAIHVDERFMNYRSGILSYDCTVSPFDQVNHAVAPVSINVQEGYVKILNSWGQWWGDNGYAKFALNKANNETCGLTRYIYQVLSVVDQ